MAFIILLAVVAIVAVILGFAVSPWFWLLVLVAALAALAARGTNR